MQKLTSQLLIPTLTIAIALLSLSSHAPNALAQDPCTGASNNLEYKDCVSRSFEAADRELNQIYKKVRSTIGPEEKEILTDAQLAWITYRDKTCDFETVQNRRGSGYRTFLNSCKERMTKARINELRAYFKK